MEMNDWKSLRTRGFRFLMHADGRETLYDLSRDPREADDVAAYAGVVTEHRHHLLRRLFARERPLARTWTY